MKIKNDFLVRLSVQKATFVNYLIRLGFNYNIKQYDDFISALRRNIIKDISNSIEDKKLRAKIIEIFGTIDVNILILDEDPYLIQNIHSKYLKTIIESGLLDNYLSEKKDLVSRERIQESAYLYNKTSKLLVNGTDVFSEYHSDKISIQRCYNSNNYTISKDLQAHIDEVIQQRVIRNMIHLEGPNIKTVKDLFNLIFLDKDKWMHDQLSRRIRDKLTTIDFIENKTLILTVSLNISKDIQKKIMTLEESISVIQRGMNPTKSELYNSFKLIQTKDRKFWENLKRTVSEKNYDRLSLQKENIENYSLPNLEDIFINLDINGKVHKLSFQELIA